MPTIKYVVLVIIQKEKTKPRTMDIIMMFFVVFQLRNYKPEASWGRNVHRSNTMCNAQLTSPF